MKLALFPAAFAVFAIATYTRRAVPDPVEPFCEIDEADDCTLGALGFAFAVCSLHLHLIYPEKLTKSIVRLSSILLRRHRQGD